MSAEVENVEVAEERPKPKAAGPMDFDFNAFESNTIQHAFEVPGFKPIMLDVKTDAVKPEHLAGYNRAIGQLSADARERAKLRVKKARLQEEQAEIGVIFFDDQVDESSLAPEELADREAFKEIDDEIKAIDKQLEELNKKPQSIDEIRVDHVITKMLAGWDAKRGGVLMPVTREFFLDLENGPGVHFIELLSDELIGLARGGITEQKKPAKRRGSKSKKG